MFVAYIYTAIFCNLAAHAHTVALWWVNYAKVLATNFTGSMKTNHTHIILLHCMHEALLLAQNHFTGSMKTNHTHIILLHCMHEALLLAQNHLRILQIHTCAGKITKATVHSTSVYKHFLVCISCTDNCMYVCV